MSDVEPIPDFKFPSAGKFDRTFRPAAILHAEIGEVADHYAANMERVVSHWEFHDLLLKWASSLEHARSESNRSYSQYSGQVIPFPLSPPDPSIDPAQFAARQQMEDQAAQRRMRIVASSTNLGIDEESYRSLIQRVPEADIEKILRGIREVLGGMVVGAWTAFEVLAEDMWRVAVRLRPNELLKAKADKGQAKTPKSLSVKLDVDKFIKSNFSIKYEIDDFIISLYDFGFGNYDKICNAYRMTFGQSFSSLNTEINRSLFDLAQTRNVIVHNAGLADHEFVERMINIASPIPAFAGVPEQATVPIDGDVVAAIVAAAAKSCVGLIGDVDAWVSSQGL